MCVLVTDQQLCPLFTYHLRFHTHQENEDDQRSRGQHAQISSRIPYVSRNSFLFPFEPSTIRLENCYLVEVEKYSLPPNRVFAVSSMKIMKRVPPVY